MSRLTDLMELLLLTGQFVRPYKYFTRKEAAAKYPDVIFSHAAGYKSNETNFNNYFGRAYQARYLAGIVAGLKSLEIGNDHIGYVSAYGVEYAETASGINGFALGVQAVKPHSPRSLRMAPFAS